MPLRARCGSGVVRGADTAAAAALQLAAQQASLQVLERISSQLSVHGVELAALRRSSEACEASLAALLALARSASGAARALARAASRQLAAAAARRRATTLRASLRSGQRCALSLALLLALLFGLRALPRRCAAQATAAFAQRGRTGRSWWHAGVRLLPAWAAPRSRRQSLLELLQLQRSRGTHAWHTARTGGICLARSTARWTAGAALLVTLAARAWGAPCRRTVDAPDAEPTPAPLDALLAAALPADTPSARLAVARALFAAAAVEGALGATAIGLLGGRWGSWLLLWLAWLALLWASAEAGGAARARVNAVRAAAAAAAQLGLPLLAAVAGLWRI